MLKYYRVYECVLRQPYFLFQGSKDPFKQRASLLSMRHLFAQTAPLSLCHRFLHFHSEVSTVLWRRNDSFKTLPSIPILRAHQCPMEMRRHLEMIEISCLNLWMLDNLSFAFGIHSSESGAGGHLCFTEVNANEGFSS